MSTNAKIAIGGVAVGLLLWPLIGFWFALLVVAWFALARSTWPAVRRTVYIEARCGRM